MSFRENMTKHLMIFFFLVSTSVATRAQSIFVEVLGRGIFNSINYEHNFSKTVDGWRAQIGMGYLPTSLISIPISGTYVFGKRNHHIELGAGATYYGGYIWGDDDKFNPATNVLGLVYYRYEKLKGKFYFKIGTPITVFDIDLKNRINFSGLPWPGIGLGYKF